VPAGAPAGVPSVFPSPARRGQHGSITIAAGSATVARATTTNGYQHRGSAARACGRPRAQSIRLLRWKAEPLGDGAPQHVLRVPVEVPELAEAPEGFRRLLKMSLRRVVDRWPQRGGRIAAFGADDVGARTSAAGRSKPAAVQAKRHWLARAGAVSSMSMLSAERANGLTRRPLTVWLNSLPSTEQRCRRLTKDAMLSSRRQQARVHRASATPRDTRRR
jgi:hypothetical protein